MKQVFVTGTDTGVGKTLVSAWLTRGWQAEYWKPVQSGSLEICDYDSVADLVPGAVIHPSAYVLREPLSPHQAARLDGVQIDLARIRLPKTTAPLIVEGAGGVMVPLNDRDLMIDLMAQLALPVVLVARSGLGTLNHTLLSLDALRRRHITVLGVVMNGPANPDNRQAIEHYGQVRVLAELPLLDAVTSSTLATLPHPSF